MSEEEVYNLKDLFDPSTKAYNQQVLDDALSNAPYSNSNSSDHGEFNLDDDDFWIPINKAETEELNKRIKIALDQLEYQFKMDKLVISEVSELDLAFQPFQVQAMRNEDLRDALTLIFFQYNRCIEQQKNSMSTKQRKNSRATVQKKVSRGFITVPTVYENVIYVPKLQRNVFGTKQRKHTFSTKDKSRIIILTIIQKALIHKTQVSKREILYCIKNIANQEQVNDAINFWCCAIGCTRPSLNIQASEKGLVVGKLQFTMENFVDCCKVGERGIAIPNNMGKIKSMRHTGARFILVVEKETVFFRLAIDKFYQKNSCIIITGKGQPDYSTRIFLRKMKNELELPVLGLMDCNYYGIQILHVYKHGSENMTFDSENLATPEIKWLGVLPSDVAKYKIPHNEVTEEEKGLIDLLMEKPYVKMNPNLSEEMKLMKSVNVDIEGFIAKGFNYLSDIYLMQKIANENWI